MDKLYLVDKYNLSIHEDKIIYEFENKYIAVHDEPSEYEDVVNCEKKRVVTDNGNFKEVFSNGYVCIFDFRDYLVFSTRDLAEEFARAVKTYGEIWSAENLLKWLNNCIKDTEKEAKAVEERLRKAKEALANGETLLHNQ